MLSRWFLVSALWVITACTPTLEGGNNPCGPDTCEGCCSADGICRTGTVTEACGVGGAVGTSCGTEACLNGVCGGPGAGGGSGGVGGGNGATGGGSIGTGGGGGGTGGDMGTGGGTHSTDGGTGGGTGTGGGNSGTLLCGSTQWCWEYPLPQGTDLHQVWGSGANDVWAVVEHGTIIRFDGTAMSSSASGATDDLLGMCGSCSN